MAGLRKQEDCATKHYCSQILSLQSEAKIRNIQIPFETFSLSTAHNQTFLKKLLLTLGEIERTEDLHGILSVLVKINFKIVFRDLKIKKSTPVFKSKLSPLILLVSG